ncbi:2-dehydro-3-deoxyphosphooctonate aldolase (KDO 8-P synthase) [Geothermobacter ehrlichii]|uniref:2-dehydro-3-deoxyphosphooctonate aldolase n=1 Tax=Geothermobacter ehrlichii TaxID=213224 RepID=A0A5D3WLY2_9BACT|nr:3-deoxy-8-phosphooctulonate synthase [Geothermobacter ehrlichii]TYO99503.1 2-dehydro-3-deoxyphosphooctonate aldolase (KDO 8-P synthase) [Geothermobacter ehrlichii]
MKRVKVAGLSIGGNEPLVLIAGPCVIEDLDRTLRIADFLAGLSARLGFGLVFKASFDKANRSSSKSYRGPGLERGLEILARVREKTGLPLISDIHETGQVEAAAEVLDILQIPAFLCRQTDLLQAAARTGKVVNVKKGQFMAPWDMRNVLTKIGEAGGESVLFTERGTTFGYNNLVVDMRSLALMRELGVPVVFDATHAVQLPGGAGDSSGGQRQFVAGLSRAAVAMGVDALFWEVHDDPDRALCDGPNSLPLDQLESLIGEILRIDRLVKTGQAAGQEGA